MGRKHVTASAFDDCRSTEMLLMYDVCLDTGKRCGIARAWPTGANIGAWAKPDGVRWCCGEEHRKIIFELLLEGTL